jgi:internalin A
VSKDDDRFNQQTPDNLSKVSALIEKCRKNQASELSLSGKDLTELPESIGNLTQLRTLDLSYNKLTELPEFIGNLTRLRTLSLGGNQLTELPGSIGNLTQLRTLSLYWSPLGKLPEFIGKLTQLQILDLSGNQLTKLPEFIGKLTQLKILDLSYNQLTKLPEFIGNLTQLQILNLYINQLTELPESIGKLTQLQHLNLYDNNLTVLPESLWSLRSLNDLYLHGNTALGLPAEVLGRSWQDQFDEKHQQEAKPRDILEYYFRVRGRARPLNEAKLILVGRGGVGKTSIVNRLVDNYFEKDEKKTEGIRITEWPLRLNRNEDVRLNVWDFGGQEIMHATHQFFLTQRSLYLLVLSGREGGEDADAEYWLKLIESFGGESPVIVLMNKIKDHAFDVNRRALLQKYPVIREFIKTDCKDETGIEQLREVIERETDHLEHLRDAFPASWFSIKNELASIKENYLSFDQYREVCARFGEEDPAAQELLASYLHSLGIALNYKDDKRLQDKHILNPHWVTNGIYKILNAESVEKKKGEIHVGDLPRILDGKEYPADMHHFLFDLMKKFDLCFSLYDVEGNYLIPELLDKQEPAEATEFKPEACLNFQYHYPVIPEGLLPRFIARTHVLSEGLPRWRTGVILKFEDNRALVKADIQDKKVFISVSGPMPSRHRLLAVIRSNFERIHMDIRNLQPREMVPLSDHPNVVVPYEELLIMEQNGMKTFPKVVAGQLVEIAVHNLLNGVDIKSARRNERADEHRNAVRLFYSYSHKDEKLRNQMEIHLKLLQRQGLIETWHDRKIEAGDEWKRKIDENLERANIILLLVSADFMASDYCYEIEMKRAMERHEKGQARVVPIIVRDVKWERAPFARLQALPENRRPVMKWTDRDTAWRNVSDGIERLVEGMRET